MTDLSNSASAAAHPGDRDVFISPRVLDRIEQVGIVVLWTWLAWRVGHSVNANAWLSLVSETTIAFFVLIRKPTEAISMRLGDWLLAITATFAPALVLMTERSIPGLAGVAIGLVVAGELFQLWAKLTLRRSFGIAPANRGIKTSGPYRFVRHPMYTGYICAQIGVLIALPSLFNLAVIGLGWIAQVLRVQREEVLLGRDAEWAAMAERVRWRLFPHVW